MEKKRVYLSGKRGDDKNDDLSGKTPVRTEAQAIKIASRQGITVIYILDMDTGLTKTVDLSG
jgi:hypothetical protein